MNQKSYTMDEIKAAFAALRLSIEEVGGVGSADTDRFLLDDVEIDVCAILRGSASWLLPAFAEPDGQELDDDSVLFVGQNYAWVAANGAW
jgi:hypothetical protein